VPVWEVAQCRIEDQAPVVTWEIALETHRLRFLINRCGPGMIVGRQNNSVGIRQKIVDVRYTKFQKWVRPQLFAETEFLDHSLITIGIVGFEIVEQATPLADQHEKTAARAVVLLVHLEVFRQ